MKSDGIEWAIIYSGTVAISDRSTFALVHNRELRLQGKALPGADLYSVLQSGNN